MDGRAFHETRSYEITHGFLQSVDGSAVCRRSNDTVVLAAVTIQVGQTLNPAGDVQISMVNDRFQSVLQNIAENSVDFEDLALHDGFAIRLDIRLTVLLGGDDALDVCIAALSAALQDTTIPMLELKEDGTYYRIPNGGAARRLKLFAVPCSLSAIRCDTWWLVDPDIEEQHYGGSLTVIVNALTENVMALELLPGQRGVSTAALEQMVAMTKHHAKRMISLLRAAE